MIGANVIVVFAKCDDRKCATRAQYARHFAYSHTRIGDIAHRITRRHHIDGRIGLR